jgi:fatty-acyl-CoA synthase
VFKAIRKLYQVNILKPRGFFYLLGSFYREGFNLMALLRFSFKLYPDVIALHDDHFKTTYDDLFKNSKKLAHIFEHTFNLEPNTNVALLCKNHLVAVQSLFALSRLGVNIYLLNVEMSDSQIKKIIDNKVFSLIIYDEDKYETIKGLNVCSGIPAYHTSMPSLFNILNTHQEFSKKIKKRRAGKIVLNTGGSTGVFKTASRNPSIRNFINHFLTILIDVNANQYRSVYVATPLYHGFGLTALILSVVMGGEMFLVKKYRTDEACKLISVNQIEIIVIVPLMLHRMLNHDRNALASVKCVISGGAALNPKLSTFALQELGNVLFNLYGTSEAGFAIMAKPEDLLKKPSTIGKPIRGVTVKIIDENGQDLEKGREGMICIKSRSVMDGQIGRWINTGDMGCIDENGYFYLRGRKDSMIVSAGENVYPGDLENELIKHENIEQAFVMGISDVEFGERLKAYVVLKEHNTMNEDNILQWLSGRVARYQMPVQIIVLEDLPMTLTGKVDRKKLTEI